MRRGTMELLNGHHHKRNCMDISGAVAAPCMTTLSDRKTKGEGGQSSGRISDEQNRG